MTIQMKLTWYLTTTILLNYVEIKLLKYMIVFNHVPKVSSRNIQLYTRHSYLNFLFIYFILNFFFFILFLTLFFLFLTLFIYLFFFCVMRSLAQSRAYFNVFVLHLSEILFRNPFRFNCQIVKEFNKILINTQILGMLTPTAVAQGL